MTAQKKYVAYGGARGGGKSWALRRKCVLLAMRYGGIRILLLRKTLQELKENHLRQLSGETKDIAAFKAGERAFEFKNGSRIKLGYCDSENDINQFQGQEYDVICMDEATQFTEFQFSCLCACMRGGIAGQPRRFYLTCNPGGIGHGWVKRLFIDRLYKDGENPADYAFIPARVFDNDYLMKNNPDYLRQLESLPEKLRSAWLYGSWDSFAGQFFSEFSRDIHVVRPFEIPAGWSKQYVNDYGLDMLAGLWIAVPPRDSSFSGRAFVYREIYESNLIVSEAARRIKSLEQDGERIEVRLAPPDLWGRSKDSGKSMIELFAENGLYFCKAESARIPGWMALREWLKPYEGSGEKAASKLQIFESCQNLIRTIPMLQYDAKIVNDAAKEPHEPTHATDALRYWAASRVFTYGNEENEDLENGAFGGEIPAEYLRAGWQ